MSQITEKERLQREKKRLKEEAALLRPKRKLSKKIWQGFWWVLLVGLVLFHGVAGVIYGGRVTDGAFIVASDVSFADVDQRLVDAGLVAEKVSYQSDLGPMDAWRTFGGNDVWIVHVHGLGGSPADLAPAMAALDDAGYPQLTISYRNDPGQPPDPSGYYQHGVTEWKDLEAAVAYAKAEGARDVILNGWSMGGAIVVAYAYRQEPGSVLAMVLDSPSLNLNDNLEFAASQEDLPFGIPVPPTLTAVASFISAVTTGSNLDLMDYLKRDGQIFSPTLVFHGTDDLKVSIEGSRALAADRPSFVRLVEIPGAGHVESVDVDPARYASTLVAFVNSNAR